RQNLLKARILRSSRRTLSSRAFWRVLRKRRARIAVRHGFRFIDVNMSAVKMALTWKGTNRPANAKTTTEVGEALFSTRFLVVVRQASLRRNTGASGSGLN